MTLLFLVLISRIYYVQVVEGAKWYDLAKNRWSAAEELASKRGSITDREGNVLAMDTFAYNVAVNPKAIHDADITEEVVDGLHKILGKSKDELRDLATAKKKETGQYYSQREVRPEGLKIDKALADKIKQFREELAKEKDVTDVGIYLSEDLKRYYPRNSLASQIVGYLDRDGAAMTGVEAYFNDQLSGEKGYIKYEKDGKRVQLAEGEVDYKPAENGQGIMLTIDSDIQHYVEEALREIVTKYAPKSATAIAADPQTMEILAMANMPEYNPNEYWENNSNSYNHAIKSLYEPGSTFKIVTLAAAVEEGVFNPNEMYKSGQIKIEGIPRAIRDIKRDGWGTISFLEGLKHSSNVAFVKLGYERLGAEKLRDYITNFGFGQKTGIQLGNELTGSIRFQYASEVANATFGQGVSVTPIQQVAAVAAVANGGKLLKPQIVKSITDPVTKTTTTFEPKVIRQVISAETSRQVGEYLEQVVSDQENGTGKNAYIEGYRVAGKTGTAQKVIGKDYSETKFVVSFIGYAPVDNPKIVVYIVVDEPNDSLVGGGTVAAPAFKQIVLKSLRKMGVAPNYATKADAEKKEVTITVPDLTELQVSQAKAELQAKAITFELVGNGKTVLQQIPAAGSSVHPTQRIYLITEQREKLAIPDLTGVSLRDALEITSLIGIRLIPEGQGFVVSQKEETLNNVRVLRVVLAPPLGAKGQPPETGEGSDSEGAVSEEDAAAGDTPQNDEQRADADNTADASAE